MKTTTKIIAAAAAAAALALAGAVSAQPGPGYGGGPGWGMGPGWGGMGPGWGHMGGWGGMGPGRGRMGGWGPMGQGGFGMMGMMGFGGYDMSAAAAGQLAALKAQLKITSAQEPAWKAYESSVTKQAGAMQALRDQFHSQWRNAKPGDPPPDMAAQHQSMLSLRQSGREAQGKAYQELWAGLSPEQQALMGPGWGRGGPRMPSR